MNIIGTLRFNNGDITVLYKKISNKRISYFAREERSQYYYNDKDTRYPYCYERELTRNQMYSFCSEYFSQAPDYCNNEYWAQSYRTDNRDIKY